jgi:1-aminocyclopropane-1-carboxylate deaminase
MLLAPQFMSQQTPLEELHDPLLDRAGMRLLVKRLDRVHPVISGNKWYKLKYNLLAAREQGHETLLSFGGAYSNHIHALAGAGREYGFNTIGVIRGEEYAPLNPTLHFAAECGMQLHYIDRETYRRKTAPPFVARLREMFGDFYLIPEGGSNALAVKGCAEIINEIDQPFDVITCACGTAGTLSGLVAGLRGGRQALGVAVLKGAGFLHEAVRELLLVSRVQCYDNWRIELDYHYGGYAKTTPELLDFIRRFESTHGIALEQVYTGKLMYALFEMIAQKRFARGTTIVALHSGGLQGRIDLA